MKRLLNRDRVEMNLDDLEQSFKTEAEVAEATSAAAAEATPSSSGAAFAGGETPREGGPACRCRQGSLPAAGLG